MNVVFTVEIPAPKFSSEDNPAEVASCLKTYIEETLTLAGVFPHLLESVKVSYAVKRAEKASHAPLG